MRLTVRGGHLHSFHRAADAALLVDEERARRGARSTIWRGAPAQTRALVRRAQLPGAQLHARRDARRRRRAVLSLVVPRAGHRRPRRGRQRGLSRRDAVRSARASTSTPKSTRDAPRWLHVDVRLLSKTRLLALDEMRADPALADMIVLKRGNRLSITPVSAAEWRHIVRAFCPDAAIRRRQERPGNCDAGLGDNTR